MTYATGGIIPSGAEPPVLSTGCDYIIPRALGWKWAAVLKDLNKELDTSDEDVLD